MASKIRRSLEAAWRLWGPVLTGNRPTCALGFFCLALAFRASAADNPDGYYHRGAQHYVFGEKKEAKNSIETGIRLFPDDAKLRQLAALLAQKEQEEKQQQQKNSEKNDQEKSESQKQDQQSSPPKEDQQKESSDSEKQQEQAQQEKKDEKSSSDPKAGQEQKEKDAKDAAKQAQAQKAKDAGEPGEEGQAGEAVMGVMTQQQAMQLLDNQKGEERAMIFLPRTKPKPQDRLFKDW